MLCANPADMAKPCHTTPIKLLGFLPAADPTSCLLTDARLLSIATVFGLSIGALVYATASFSGALIQVLGCNHGLGALPPIGAPVMPVGILPAIWRLPHLQ